MSNIGRPYTTNWLPVSQAAHALTNQADTIFDELNASIDRAHAIRAKMKARALEKEAAFDSAVAMVRRMSGKAEKMTWHEARAARRLPCWHGLQNGGWDVT